MCRAWVAQVDAGSQDQDCHYCTISFNLARPMTHDNPAKILVLVSSQSYRDVLKNFGSLALQAAKYFLFLVCDPRQFWHPTKITVTSMTFQHFGGPCDI
jgi:hypothetical protein